MAWDDLARHSLLQAHHTIDVAAQLDDAASEEFARVKLWNAASRVILMEFDCTSAMLAANQGSADALGLCQALLEVLPDGSLMWLAVKALLMGLSLPEGAQEGRSTAGDAIRDWHSRLMLSPDTLLKPGMKWVAGRKFHSFDQMSELNALEKRFLAEEGAYDDLFRAVVRNVIKVRNGRRESKEFLLMVAKNDLRRAFVKYKRRVGYLRPGKALIKDAVDELCKTMLVEPGLPDELVTHDAGPQAKPPADRGSE